MESGRADSRTTLVVGASTDPARYAFVAAKMLDHRKLDFIPIGIKKGLIFGKEIRDLKSKPQLGNIHTITLYIGPAHQTEWMEYLIGLKPKRIIFNPGAENPEFFKKARFAGIEAIEACTLVLLSTGQF